MLFPAFNQSIWTDYDDTHAGLSGWKAFGLLLGIQVILDLLVLTQSPIVLYPVAFISVLGVVLLLTMVYTIVWVMITGPGKQVYKNAPVVVADPGRLHHYDDPDLWHRYAAVLVDRYLGWFPAGRLAGRLEVLWMWRFSGSCLLLVCRPAPG